MLFSVFDASYQSLKSTERTESKKMSKNFTYTTKPNRYMSVGNKRYPLNIKTLALLLSLCDKAGVN